MGVTIAVLSQKGGTGKTTTVRTLADVFRRVGLSVLVVDLDPQGNLSDYFDVPPDASPTIADVLVGRAEAKDAVHNDVLPANLTLAEAELALAGKMGRELTLRRALRTVAKDFDVVLLDCPPTLGLLTVNALVAADHARISEWRDCLDFDAERYAAIYEDATRDAPGAHDIRSYLTGSARIYTAEQAVEAGIVHAARQARLPEAGTTSHWWN